MIDLGQMLRGSPTGDLKKAQKRAKAIGVDVSLQALEAHHLSGGDPNLLIEALEFAQANSIEISWMEAQALDLATRSSSGDIMQVLLDCVPTHKFSFDTFSPEDPELLVGFTRDGHRVKADCTLTYRKTPSHFYGDFLKLQQEYIAVMVAILINKSSRFDSLKMAIASHEAKILSKYAEKGVQSVSIEYTKYV